MTLSLFPSEVVKFREQAGLTQRQLSSRIRSSTSSLCRWERGEVTPRREHVERLDEALGASGQLLRTWQAQTSGSSLPPWMRDAGRLQEEAASIDCISPVLVPGLLQSPAYAWLVFREGRPLSTDSEIARLVALRCERYESLRHRNDPWITAVFPQTALSGVTDEVRVEQVRHLLSLTDSGRVSVHLVPEGTLLVGVTSPLLMVRLLNGGSAASSDHVCGNVIHDNDGEDWDRLTELAKRAFAAALPPRQSRRILEEMS
ncbi:helix-turn-helix domain-containing protein [Salinactinospora qingdaonensis]|uniref:HTH cro/C1-type domain-containing protein n=1 Tax=Salinactinospora qingdaonensis TaxID=702744 RepID=A0ABP7FNF3_9ACTN